MQPIILRPAVIENLTCLEVYLENNEITGKISKSLKKVLEREAECPILGGLV